ncbi:MAG: exonuclease domain-containing protein [bacterium]
MDKQKRSIWDLEYIIVDFETTGSLAPIDRIIEVGAVLFSRGEIIDYFSSLVHPGRSIPPFITFLTGITPEMLRSAPPPEVVIPKLMDLVKDRIFVAHNARFDLTFLNYELERLGLPKYQGDVLCTLNMARRILNLSKRGLDSLAEYFGIEIIHRHRAVYDAEATALILDRMLKILNSEGIFTWEDLQRRLDGSYKVPPNFLKLKYILEEVPHNPGVVLFLDASGDVLYITKSKDLKNKLSNYFYIQEGISQSRQELLKNTTSLEYIITTTEFEAYLLEKELLQMLEPKFNRPYQKKQD